MIETVENKRILSYAWLQLTQTFAKGVNRGTPSRSRHTVTKAAVYFER